MELPRRSFLAGAFLVVGPAGSAAVERSAAPGVARGDTAGRASPEDALHTSQFVTLNAALAAWTVKGGRLVVDQDIVTSQTFGPGEGVLLPDKDYVLETLGRRTIAYDGPIAFEFLRLLQTEGRANLQIRGPLTIDCRGRASTGVWIDNQFVTGTDRRDVIVDGLHVMNCKLHTNHAGGANGIVFNGGAGQLVIRNWSVRDITRRAGAGQAGSYGTAGLVVFGHSTDTANPRRVLIEKFHVSAIATEDRPGTAAYSDGDGVLVFQYKVGDDDVEAPVIREGVIENAFGRAIKRYATAFGGLTEDITVIRSVQGVNTGSIDIAHQDGSGVIRDIRFIYSGAAHVTPTKPVGMSLGVRANPGHGAVENIRIEDTTGAVKGCLVQLYYNLADPAPRHYAIRNVTDTGKAECIFLPGALGATGRVSIALEDIDCELTKAVCLTDDHIVNLTVTGTRLVNRGPDVPVVRTVTGRNVMKPDRWGSWRGDATLRGFTRYSGRGIGSPNFSNGFSGPGSGAAPGR
jgi:hypothetical protein